MPRYQHVNSQYQYQQDYMILDTQFDTNLIRKKDEPMYFKHKLFIK